MPRGVGQNLAESRKNDDVFFLCMCYLSCVLGVDLAAHQDRNRGGIRPQHLRTMKLRNVLNIFKCRRLLSLFLLGLRIF